MALILCQIPLCMSLMLVRCTIMTETSNMFHVILHIMISFSTPGHLSFSEKNVFKNQDIIEISIKLHVVITFNTVVTVSCKG